jgi:hypothetical protein
MGVPEFLVMGWFLFQLVSAYWNKDRVVMMSVDGEEAFQQTLHPWKKAVDIVIWCLILWWGGFWG